MIELHNNKAILSIDETDGAIVSLKSKSGTEYVAKPVPIIAVRLLDTEKQERTDVFSEGKYLSEAKSDNDEIILGFSGMGGLEIDCTATISSTKQGFEFSLKIENGTGFAIEWVDYPVMRLKNMMKDAGGDFKFLKTRQEGSETDTLAGYHHFMTDYPNKGWDGTYPGPTGLQFQAYYNGKEGFYFGDHDAESNLKVIDGYLCDGDIAIENKLLPGLKDNARYEYPFKAIVREIEGTWADAAEVYRNFAETSGMIKVPKFKENERIPEWIADCPIVVIYPVRGDEDIGKMDPNMYYPYTNALPYLDKLKEQLDSRFLVLLCHWEGSAPWAPPFVWPPYGDKKNFLEFVDKVHERGDLFGVYCSGTAWTEESIVDPSYNTKKMFEERNYSEIMATGIDQKLSRAYICNGNIRWGYDMCIHTEGAREIILNEVNSVINKGKVDYIQYFDQNLGGLASVCYNKKHGHPATPGKWLVEDTLTLLKDVNGIIYRAGKKGKASVGCESAAADCYMGEMPFNDGRNYGFTDVKCVPVYDYVYHEYVNNYMGNCNTSFFTLDVGKHPEYLFYRTGYLFTTGTVLTVVLKNDGKLHWDWSSPWKLPDVDQQAYGEYVKTLNSWKKGLLKGALTYGRMLKPLETECGEYSFTRKDGEVKTYPSLNSTRWLCDDGEEVQVVVNYSGNAETFGLRTDEGIKCVEVYDEPDCAFPVTIIPENGICRITVKARNAVKITIKR